MRRAVLVLLTLPLVGCQTAGGTAIAERAGQTFERLYNSTSTLIGGELGRPAKLGQTLRNGPFAPQRRAGQTLAGARALAEGTLAEAAALPGNALHTTGSLADRGLQRAFHLADPDRELYQRHAPGRMLRELLDSIVRFLAKSPDRVILPGPGDPHLTTDPEHTKRRETLFERLLLRL